MNYYNEFDPKAAAWLRELINQGLIPRGDVDTRSIADVLPTDLVGYAQCHFFAGIGGWPLALERAGWPEDRLVWTGSCPCQPFSQAGKQLAERDDRHLWPVFFDLIGKCQPSAIFGEQVASKLGREWLSGVFADLEGVGYAVAGADLCAAGVGAPHIRQRLYWVANRKGERWKWIQNSAKPPGRAFPQISGINGRLADAEHPERRPECRSVEDERHGHDAGRAQAHGEPGACREVRGMGEPDSAGPQSGRQTAEAARYRNPAFATGDIRGAWSDFELLPCRDGKTRRTQSGLFPLAHGVPARVGRLRGYGNAIVPQIAAEFIKAAIEILG